jgi:hypothetical protein
MAEEKNNKDINDLAKEKAEEIIYRQKIQELTNSVTEIVRTIPQSLRDIRYALDSLEKESERDYENFASITTKVNESIEKISKDLNNLADKIRSLEKVSLNEEKNSKEIANKVDELNRKIIDKNNDDSLVIILNELFKETMNKIVSRDNNDSIISILEREFKKTQDENREQIQKNLNVRSWVTWILATAGTLVAILFKLFGS